MIGLFYVIMMPTVWLVHRCLELAERGVRRHFAEEQQTEEPTFEAVETPGTADNPLRVSLVSFHGYAPAILANGHALTTVPGSQPTYFEDLGLHVSLLLQDEIPSLASLFGEDRAHCAWRTSDFWAQEHPLLRDAGLDARAVMIVDNTQGADAIVTRDPNVSSIEDLVGKRIALLQFTPSHGLLLDAMENASLTDQQRAAIDMHFVPADQGPDAVLKLLLDKEVDTAVLWDPVLSLAKYVPDVREVYSTRDATNLIYDVIVCDSRYLRDPASARVIQALVEGWMQGIANAEEHPTSAAQAIALASTYYRELERDNGLDFIEGLFANLLWTNLADNVRILGLAGGPNHYERVYGRFDELYREAGALDKLDAPVIDPSTSFDTRFIEALLAQDPAALLDARMPEFSFSEAGRELAQSAPPLLTRAVHVPFATNASDIGPKAESVIDKEIVDLIESHGAAYIEVSGHTDSRGAAAANKALSYDRAAAVVDYLVRQWEFPRQRFVVVGHGASQPVCDEETAQPMTLAACQAANRATRVAVLRKVD